MKKCIKTDNPLVTIALAVYKPDLQWFAALLTSLNQQTYSNVELLVWNDCPEYDVPLEFIEKYITRFPVKLYCGEKNMGSNYAFERLTELAEGEYISYCDQDDIWEKEKISVLVQAMKQKKGALAYSDLSIIDAEGKKVCESIKEIRKRTNFVSGEGLATEFLIKNCISGCAMLIKSDIAKKAIPFEKDYVHDQWLALFASAEGKIVFVDQSLIKYRQHDSNQTGVLSDAKSKEEYYQNRIVKLQKRIQRTRRRIDFDNQKRLAEICRWIDARRKYYEKPGITSFLSLWKYRKCGVYTTLFELFLPFMPKRVYIWVVNLIRKGII